MSRISAKGTGGTLGAHTHQLRGVAIPPQVPSLAQEYCVARLIVPAWCTGILALPGARDRFAGAREIAFFAYIFCVCVCVCLCVCVCVCRNFL